MTDISPTIVRSKTPSNPMSTGIKSFTSTSKRADFDLVVVGTCPHCGSLLGKEIRGRGAGVTRICEQCEHRWYLNRRIKRTRCLTCFAEQRRNKRNFVRNNALPNALVSQRGNGLYSGAGADESRWASRTSNQPQQISQPTQLIESFIASRRNGLSPRTIHDSYRCYLKLSQEVIALNTSSEDIRKFLATRKCSNGGRHAYYRVLRCFFNWLFSHKSGFNLNPQLNPILAVDAPKVGKIILPSLTPEQLDYLINNVASVRDKAIISLFADSGLRLTELANITTHNIDWEHRLIKVKCKGNKEGYAVFGERTEKLLREWLQEHKNGDGRLWDINRWSIVDMLRRLEAKTGLPCNPHTFRRTFASILAKRGVDSLHIMRLGRWESMAMVERYTKSVKFEDSLKLYTSIVA